LRTAAVVSTYSS